jgi:hypothetical protein
MVQLSTKANETNAIVFVEKHANIPLAPVPMANTKFGIELELSVPQFISYGNVVHLIESRASVNVRDMTGDYEAARDRNDVWVLMSDSSLTCSANMPRCTKFELVSRILKGEKGIEEVSRVINALEEISSIKVNSSMGFHVHVNVSHLSLSDLKKFCQNFVKYESAMDSIMPPSRRRGNNYCQSNRVAIADTIGTNASNKEVHETIKSCTSKEELRECISPEKYYKLNLNPLVSGRQPTIGVSSAFFDLQQT